MLPQEILEVRCLEMPFTAFSSQYLGLKNNQTYDYMSMFYV